MRTCPVMKIKVFKKILSIALALNLLIQGFAPFLVTTIYADDSTPSAEIVVDIPESTPPATPEIVSTPSSEITSEVTPTSTETPVITSTPVATPSVEPSPSSEPTPSVSQEASSTPTSNPDSQAPSSANDSNSSNTSSDTTTPASIPQPLTIVPQLEQTLSATPTLTTDKSDYFPTDTVYISGKGFLPNTIYILNISSLDNPIFIYKPQVISDSNGNISFSFTLDGNYRPNYSVEAVNTAGKVVASFSFTDDQDQLTICHATSSNSNPYTTNSPNIQNDGSLSGGHLNHTGPLYPISGWGDIIPPYDHGSFHYSGMNWSAAGIAIYNNGCNIPSDLTLTKTNNLTNSTGTVGQNFSWKIRVDNIGANGAKFQENEVILSDSLPNTNVTYGVPTYFASNVNNFNDLTCSINSFVLSCKVNNNKNITINVGGYLEVTITTIFSADGTYTNPRIDGLCQVDPNDKIHESNELNNSCSNTVTINPTTGTIQVKKIVSPADDSLWDFTISGPTNNTANSLGNNGQSSVFISNPGSYTISETGHIGTTTNNYSSSYDCLNGQTSIASGNGTSASLILTSGQNIICTFTNTKFASISGSKLEDSDDDIQTNEYLQSPVSGWVVSLWRWDTNTFVDTQITATTDSEGRYTFNNLLPGLYQVREEVKSGWTNLLPVTVNVTVSAGDVKTGIDFVNVDENNKVTICHATGSESNPYNQISPSASGVYHGHLGNDHQNGQDIIPPFTYKDNVYSQNWDAEGQAIYRANCSGNADESDDPQITIRKSNNASSDKTPGDAVTYRIVINVTESDVHNLIVKDLLPKGFVYRSGSYQVRINGLPVSVSEPVYHSPGTWNVGNVQEGDQIELIYIADIRADQQPGNYLDVVWAQGTSLSDNSVLAIADDSSKVDTNFAGTTVNVIKDQTRSDNYSVEKKETVVGQVLGASTDLPATGANELWLLASVLCLGLGVKLIRSSK